MQDSALSGIKPARDAMTQAILPIRGKTINVEKNDLQTVMASETVKLILSTLGCGTGDDYSEKDLKYDKVIILCDGDTDNHA